VSFWLIFYSLSPHPPPPPPLLKIFQKYVYFGDFGAFFKSWEVLKNLSQLFGVSQLFCNIPTFWDKKSLDI